MYQITLVGGSTLFSFKGLPGVFGGGVGRGRGCPAVVVAPAALAALAPPVGLAAIAPIAAWGFPKPFPVEPPRTGRWLTHMTSVLKCGGKPA